MILKTRMGLSHQHSVETNTHIYSVAEIFNSASDSTLYYEYTYMDHQDSFGMIRVSSVPEAKQIPIRWSRSDPAVEEIDDQYSYRISSAAPYSILDTAQGQHGLESSTVAENDLDELLDELGIDQGFFEYLEISLGIDTLRRDPFVDIAERFAYLLDLSRDSDDNDTMSARSFRDAVDAIESVSIVPAAIGMDYTGELEVVWKSRQGGVSVIVDFLDDGKAWYYVSMDREEIQSDTVRTENISQVISRYLSSR